MIGMFVATLPYRIQLDSRWSFNQLVKQVREKCLSILEHSHYPLQHILTDFRLNPSNVSFLETLFDFITISSDVDHFSLNGACFQQVSIEQSYDVAKFDFSMIFIYNPTLSNNQLSCSLVCSRDLFEETTVTQISRRFQYFCEELFSTKADAIPMNESMTSISRLSLILPEEKEEIQTMKFHRLKNIVNEGNNL
jgi:non-ribosomal peptide synthetase component F